MKNKFYFLMLGLGLMLGAAAFTSCSEDDEDPVGDTQSNLVGTWSNDLNTDKSQTKYTFTSDGKVTQTCYSKKEETRKYYYNYRSQEYKFYEEETDTYTGTYIVVDKNANTPATPGVQTTADLEIIINLTAHSYSRKKYDTYDYDWNDNEKPKTFMTSDKDKDYSARRITCSVTQVTDKKLIWTNDGGTETYSKE